MKEENLKFNNLKIQTKLIKYVKSYGKKNVKNCMFLPRFLTQIDRFSVLGLGGPNKSIWKFMATRRSYVHKSMLTFSGASPKC